MKSYEMVETLSDKAHVSLEQAKEALEKSGWDILDAAICLERQKAAAAPQPAARPAQNTSYYVSSQLNGSSGSFSTPGAPLTDQSGVNKVGFGGSRQQEAPAYKSFPKKEYIRGDVNYTNYTQYTAQNDAYADKDPGFSGNGSYSGKTPPIGESIGKAAGYIEHTVNSGFGSYFNVTRRGQTVMSIPLIVALIIFLAMWWMIIPLIVFGAAFECTYSVGPAPSDTKPGNVFRDETINSVRSTAQRAKDTIINETNNVKKAYEESRRSFAEDYNRGKQNAKVQLSKDENDKK